MAWETRKILDHGFVSLIDSMPVPLRGTGDDRIVQAARVSMAHLPDDVLQSIGLEPKNEARTNDQDKKLVRYLWKNKHGTPFEKVNFEFCVKVPIFVMRQWIRHRIGSFNEVSARYSVLPCEFYVPADERMQEQSASNKQASGDLLDSENRKYCRAIISNSSEESYRNYESLLKQGLSRELARMVLPTNFYTTFYWTVNLRSLFNFLELRLHSHAQYEIRVYAEAMLEMVRKIAPEAVAVFEETLVK